MPLNKETKPNLNPIIDMNLDLIRVYYTPLKLRDILTVFLAVVLMVII